MRGIVVLSGRLHMARLLEGSWGIVNAGNGEAKDEGHEAEQDPGEGENGGHDITFLVAHGGVAIAFAVEDFVLE